MKYFIDTEFIEGFTNPWMGKRRHFIELISIGIVCEDGREYYAISRDFDPKLANEWVKENVLSKLPSRYYQQHDSPSVKEQTLLWKNETDIRDDIRQFVKPYGESVEFWGYYADYDWVLFCSLFGTMMDLPDGFPMYCKDLQQLIDSHGLTSSWKKAYCPDPEGEHNALVDAKWNQKLYGQIETTTKGGLHWGETLMGHFKPDAG